MVSYTNIYPGADDFLIPSYDSDTYHIDAPNIGLTLDGRSANQLKDVGTRMASGARNVEFQGVDPRIMDSIPKGHFKEASKAMKLAGVKPSIHAPVIEPSGITQQGWDELSRKGAESQMASAVLRSHDLDPKGNVPVTFHSTGGLPEMEQVTREGKKVGQFYVIDPRTGKWGAIKLEKRYFPEEGKFVPEGRELDVKKELEGHNKNEWVQSLSGINRYVNYGEQTIEELYKSLGIRTPEQRQEINELFAKTKKIDIDTLPDLERERLKQLERGMNHGEIYLKDAYQHMKSMFEMAYEKAPEKDKKALREFAQEIAPKITADIENDPQKLKQFGELIEKGLKVLNKIETPKLYVPLKDFALDKSSQTFANVAETAYNKFGKTAPIVNIENPPAGMFGFSKAEDLKKLVKESREKLAENLIKNKNLGKSEAKRISEQIIGATWDVGHINMLRKHGYTEKDIIKQTEIIAPFVKHVHLSDNFGFEHTELPMGMGNVPIKEIMKRLGEKGFEAPKIIEAVDWYQHFQNIPGQPPKGGISSFAQTLQSFGSPIYPMKAGPYWDQTKAFSTYTFAPGQGAIGTPVSQSTYGLGFSSLPIALGGEIAGPERGRFAAGG